MSADNQDVKGGPEKAVPDVIEVRGVLIKNPSKPRVAPPKSFTSRKPPGGRPPKQSDSIE